MTLLLQGWEDCLEKGTRDVMSLENGPPCVHWRLEREREKFKKKKEERSDVKSDYGRGVVLFTISRMQKLRDLRDSEREKVRQATYKIASCEIKAEIIDQPLPPPPPSGLFSSSMNRGGISNNARWKPTLPRPAVFIRVGVARCGSLH